MQTKLILDNQFVRIVGASRSVIRQIEGITSYLVQGFYFSPAYRKNRWDGKEHLLKYSTKHGYRVPSGLFLKIANHLKSEGIPFKVVNNKRPIKERFELDWNENIELREHQKECVEAILKKPLPGNGLAVMPIRSGKTITAGKIIQELGVSSVFCVTSQLLLHQTIKSFEELFQEPIGMIGDGTWDEQRVTVATVQSLDRARNQSGGANLGVGDSNVSSKGKYARLIANTDLVFFDECFPAGTMVGDRKIEEIKEGQFVDSYHKERKSFCQRKVLKTFKRPAKELVKVILGTGHVIYCTPEHPFLTGVGWKDAKDLMRHDFVLRVSVYGQRFVPVIDSQYISPKRVKEKCPDGYVYNIEVEETNTYLVDGFVAHNCHHLKGKSWHTVFQDFDSFYKMGLSATVFLDNEKEQEKGVIWLRACCGDVRYHTTPSRLIKDGWLMCPDINLYKVHEPKGIEEHKWSKSLQNEAVYENEFRNELICDLAKKHIEGNRKVLIVSNRINQVERLSMALSDLGLMFAVITGRTPSQKRQEIIEDYVEGHYDVLLGTVFGEGVDLPSVEVVINAEGGKDVKSTIQKMRNLTPSKGKTEAIYIDFVDMMNPYFAAHSLERFRTYREEEAFKIKVCS